MVKKLNYFLLLFSVLTSCEKTNENLKNIDQTTYFNSYKRCGHQENIDKDLENTTEYNKHLYKIKALEKQTKNLTSNFEKKIKPIYQL